MERHSNRVVLAAVIVGLALRIAFSLGYWVDKPLTNDEIEYLELARNITLGRGVRYDPRPIDPNGASPQQFGRAPGYPVFLALVARGTLRSARPVESPTAVKIAQSVVGAIGVALVGLAAARAAGAGAGAIAAAVAAVYPPLVWMPAYVLSETLYSVLALASALLLSLAVERPRSPANPYGGWELLAAGVVAGAGALTRPVMLFFILLAAAWLVGRRSVRWAALFAAGVLLVVAPWTARNIREHGRLVLVASQGGVNFWTGNHPAATGDGDMAANPQIKLADQELRRRYPEMTTAEQLEPIYYREALRYITAHPLWWLGLVGRKLFFLVVPIGPSYTLHSRRYVLASVIPYGLILPFAVAGALALWRHRAPPQGLWLLALSMILAALIFFPQERFRIPVLDPTLIVCASAWIASRDGRRRTNRRLA